jgi:hypothetical protein
VKLWSRVAGRVGSLVSSPAARVGLFFVLLAFCAAPVPGDVGGCNQTAVQLDAVAFFTAKQRMDCERCNECGLVNQTCEAACAAAPVQQEFTEGCLPLVHDGEVCLRALEAANCDDYASFVRENGPSAPTECDFCPRRSQ